MDSIYNFPSKSIYILMLNIKISIFHKAQINAFNAFTVRERVPFYSIISE